MACIIAGISEIDFSKPNVHFEQQTNITEILSES